ncbi:hypothetical protein AVEN_10009-1 [Araneus ventricosus]|uniref:Uncharacterized protein n=1 Tax=Araneus ventricosus TaxID=182803 RepID=A0A4Y2LUG8_ARAVE|nr:hypothetical protein AVEN_10009-1 [Araneus ventricosus]
MSAGVIIFPHISAPSRKNQEVIQKFKREKWSHPQTTQILHTIWVPHIYLNMILFKQWCENSCRELAQWTGTRFLKCLVKQVGPVYRKIPKYKMPPNEKKTM